MSVMEKLDCGHRPTPSTGLATGVARYEKADGSTGTMCYSCADNMERLNVQDSIPGDRLTFYVSSDGRTITTWTGGKIMDHVQYGSLHPWSDERRYLTARDEQGRIWSGTGAPGMWAPLRLTKAARRK